MEDPTRDWDKIEPFIIELNELEDSAVEDNSDENSIDGAFDNLEEKLLISTDSEADAIKKDMGSNNYMKVKWKKHLYRDNGDDLDTAIHHIHSASTKKRTASNTELNPNAPVFAGTVCSMQILNKTEEEMNLHIKDECYLADLHIYGESSNIDSGSNIMQHSTPENSFHVEDVYGDSKKGNTAVELEGCQDNNVKRNKTVTLKAGPDISPIQSYPGSYGCLHPITLPPTKQLPCAFDICPNYCTGKCYSPESRDDYENHNVSTNQTRVLHGTKECMMLINNNRSLSCSSYSKNSGTEKVNSEFNANFKTQENMQNYPEERAIAFIEFNTVDKCYQDAAIAYYLAFKEFGECGHDKRQYGGNISVTFDHKLQTINLPYDMKVEVTVDGDIQVLSLPICCIIKCIKIALPSHIDFIIY